MPIDDLQLPNKDCALACAACMLASALGIEAVVRRGLGGADLIRDCMALCGMVARLAAADSRLLADMARQCAQACERCADEIEQHDVPELRQCAAAAREAAKACRRQAARTAAA